MRRRKKNVKALQNFPNCKQNPHLKSFNFSAIMWRSSGDLLDPAAVICSVLSYSVVPSLHIKEVCTNDFIRTRTVEQGAWGGVA
jgi:hypothetical protein